MPKLFNYQTESRKSEPKSPQVSGFGIFTPVIMCQNLVKKYNKPFKIFLTLDYGNNQFDFMNGILHIEFETIKPKVIY